MKFKVKVITEMAVSALLILAADNLHAQTNLITISSTIEMQGPVTNDGAVTTLAEPAQFSLTTKQILNFMAIDENAEGTYDATRFPTGAKLVEIDTPNSVDYQVLDKSDNFLADVTNVLYIGHSTNEIYIGKVDDSTGLNDRMLTSKYRVRYDYNDSGISGGAGLEFYFYGLVTKIITDTVPEKRIYTETKLSKASPAIGDGNYQGLPFVMAGTIIQSRSGTFILNP